MKTVTIFQESRLEMDSFGDQWTDWQAIIEDPKSSQNQKTLATKLKDAVSDQIAEYFKEDGYDRIVTDKRSCCHISQHITLCMANVQPIKRSAT